ncbi:MAG: protein kinase [Polyangia bacterium]|jgi:tRNA A-37 threonylcarbamoyl transferase component Bud32
MSFVGTDRFKVIRHLGSGAMGTVYLVFDRQLGAEVALKLLDLSGGMDLYRFKSEFRSLADIKHPNLATLHELICEGPLWLFTMEYVAGVPFDVYLLGPAPTGDSPASSAPEGADTLRRTDPAQVTSRPQPERQRLLQALRQLCAGVHAMHEAGCIHRDLKPSNVLVTPEGRVVVLDFGLARQTGTRSLGGDGLLGTPAYMAPEQAKDKPSQPAADWYAVGAMLYEVLTGRLPHGGALVEILLKKQSEDPPAPVEVNPLADPELSRLCMQLLRRDPAQRPGGADILALLGTGSTPEPLSEIESAPVRAGAPVFIGRAAELQTLRRGYSSACAGNLGLVLVEGSSGIGKTALVERFLDHVTASADPFRKPLILRGRCHERETLPFKAFDSIVDALAHNLVSLGTGELAQVLPEGAAYLSEIFPVMRRLEQLDRARYWLPTVQDATELRNRAFSVFRELLTRLAHRQPVVAFIDDLQWADRDSFALLQSLLRDTGVPGLMLVATCRPVSPDDPLAAPLRAIAAYPAVKRVEVGPLSPEAASALVDRLAASGEIDQPVKQRLAVAVLQEAGGNPLFTLELIRYLCDVVLPRGEPSDLTAGEVVSLDALILERLRALPAESQSLLKVIAVAGGSLPQKALADAAGVALGSEGWERGISALTQARLIRRGGGQGSDVVEPYHDRIGEAVLGGLDAAALRQLRTDIAHAMEKWGRERTDMLARYWLEADDHERAKHYAREAAVQARTKLAFDRAAQLYQTAAALESHPDARRELLHALGDCQASNGLPSLAAEAYQQAAALSEPDLALRLHHLAAEQLLRGGHIVRGLEILDKVLDQAGLRLARGPRHALVAVTWRLLWLRVRGIKFEERPPSSIPAEQARLLDVLWSVNTGLGVVDTLRADDFLLRFLLLALKAGDIRRVAQGLGVLAGQLAALGKPYLGWANRLVAQAEILARRSSDAPIIGLARMCRAMVRYFAGEFDAVANELGAVEQYLLTHCLNVGWELATTRSFACFSLRLSGRLRELGECFDRYTADADRTGDRFLATNLRTYQSTVWLMRDDPDRAARDIEGVLDSWPRDLYHVQHFFHLYARCEQALYRERPDQARDALAAEHERFAESRLLKISGIRIEHAWISGRVALAMAETLPVQERLPYLRQARSHARSLARAEHQTGVAMGALLEAGIRWLEPAPSRAVAVVALERAVATAEAASALLLAESGRRWLGELCNNPEGEELADRSRRWMIKQGVLDPDSIAHLIAPGFRCKQPDCRA